MKWGRPGVIVANVVIVAAVMGAAAAVQQALTVRDRRRFRRPDCSSMWTVIKCTYRSVGPTWNGDGFEYPRAARPRGASHRRGRPRLPAASARRNRMADDGNRRRRPDRFAAVDVASGAASSHTADGNDRKSAEPDSVDLRCQRPATRGRSRRLGAQPGSAYQNPGVTYVTYKL